MGNIGRRAGLEGEETRHVGRAYVGGSGAAVPCGEARDVDSRCTGVGGLGTAGFTVVGCGPEQRAALGGRSAYRLRNGVDAVCEDVCERVDGRFGNDAVALIGNAVAVWVR